MAQEGWAPVVVRLAEAVDAPRCADIFLEGRRAAFPWRPREFFRLRDYYDCTADEEVWVADTGAAAGVVGFVSAALPDGVIRNLFVADAWRNRGIGRKLLDCALSHLDGMVHLRCDARNVAACGFYQRAGWHGVSVPHGEFVLFRRLADGMTA